MVKGQFRVVEGEFKGSSIFMNQLVDEGWKINMMNDFLQSLDVIDPEDIYFESYSDYNDLILEIAEEREKAKIAKSKELEKIETKEEKELLKVEKKQEEKKEENPKINIDVFCNYGR